LQATTTRRNAGSSTIGSATDPTTTSTSRNDADPWLGRRDDPYTAGDRTRNQSSKAERDRLLSKIDEMMTNNDEEGTDKKDE